MEYLNQNKNKQNMANTFAIFWLKLSLKISKIIKKIFEIFHNF